MDAIPQTSGTNGMSDRGANSAGYEWVVTGAVLRAAGFDAVVRRKRAG